jgi:hypothetical protein
MNDNFPAAAPVGEPQSATSIVAAIPQDAFRSLFHLLVGKPDSQHKILKRKVTVEPRHLYDLHNRVIEKLSNHHVGGMITATAELSFEDKVTKQFGTWAEFQNHRWDMSKVTREVRLSWLFLLKTEHFEVPQRHALTVKIAASGKPLELLQAMLAQDPDDISPERIEQAPMVCRVDFISNVLAQELIQLVEEWNKSLPRPQSEQSWIHKIENSGNAVARLVHYSTPVALAFLCIAVLRYLTADATVGVEFTFQQAVWLMQWLFGSLIALYVGEKLSLWLAERCYKALTEYGKHCMFRLTSGDAEASEKVAKKNQRHVQKFVVHACGSLILNVVAGIVTAKLW